MQDVITILSSVFRGCRNVLINFCLPKSFIRNIFLAGPWHSCSHIGNQFRLQGKIPAESERSPWSRAACRNYQLRLTSESPDCIACQAARIKIDCCLLSIQLAAISISILCVPRRSPLANICLLLTFSMALRGYFSFSLSFTLALVPYTCHLPSRPVGNIN